MKTLTSRLSRCTGAGLVALALGAALPVMAQRDPMPPRDGASQASYKGMQRHGPEAVARRVDRMLDGLNVGDAERARIRQIAQAAAADIASEQQAGRQLHAQALRLFAAPVVDAAAAEQLRVQMVAQHDRVSRRRLQALLDISALLTPEQRAAAVQRMARHGPGMRDGMHERMHGGHPHGQPPAPARP